MPNNAYKCAIAVPCNSAIEPATDAGLRELEKRGFHIHRVYGYSAIDQARCRITYDLIYREKYGALMWIDSDIDFNPDDVEKFTHLNLPILGGAYAFKGYPIVTVQPLFNQEIVFSPTSPLVEVECLATGFLYVKAEVFHNMKDKLHLPICNSSFGAPQIPFFQPAVFKGGDDETYYLGEDFSFCKRAREIGYKIMLDPAVELGHIGKYTYGIPDVINKVGAVAKPNAGKPLTYKHNTVMSYSGSVIGSSVKPGQIG